MFVTTTLKLGELQLAVRKNKKISAGPAADSDLNKMYI